MREYPGNYVTDLLPENAILTATEVAKAFRVSEETIRRWADQWRDSGGQEGLPGFKVGKQWRFYRKAVFDHFVSGQDHHPANRTSGPLRERGPPTLPRSVVAVVAVTATTWHSSRFGDINLVRFIHLLPARSVKTNLQ
jgi:excisionase family DNA binding protein